MGDDNNVVACLRALTALYIYLFSSMVLVVEQNTELLLVNLNHVMVFNQCYLSSERKLVKFFVLYLIEHWINRTMPFSAKVLIRNQSATFFITTVASLFPDSSSGWFCYFLGFYISTTTS